ncbi:MAG TPA: aminoacyl-tRNA hydrolase [Plasticicumulans sp.]|uniref:aminoacyl-tRNA hydrolase n=1 Tax=Plasticicumulans sp. TaxID=2307179 RepID=UPI002C0000E9|nr:aminoacyl-tRNA hydrolase [Plasticicumulans sp.]HMV39013.1 aminoacyl-tRNA hydrolase [Plasticicumulans sp.]HMW30024.1 aminoacyl-tRNA hydrolase [Plasticicumulans sp.]HMW43020.1 aminoacyl-tRNA hydrolase [Plasticicumulans sp.]HMX53339.1 aminoacyl-tRNA hydrolase [Plasticicumulans sp.]HMZ10890.1 aminoacyl-tRNA hydrolase [Plasticicumulans sp.]
MAEALKLIAGLGNPGPAYERTRHNAGFWFVDELARSHGGSFRHDPKLNADTCQITVEGRALWLMKPMGFMNRSGQPLARLANFYKIARPSILVVHDELDLPPGVARLKRGGGHGGHNGLRDIIAQCGGNDFLRLRLGIGHPGTAAEVVDYVLRKAPSSEQQLIERALDDALRVLPLVVRDEFERAMQTLHTRAPA